VALLDDEQVIRLDPSDAAAYNGKGVPLNSLEHDQEATRAFEKARSTAAFCRRCIKTPSRKWISFLEGKSRDKLRPREYVQCGSLSAILRCLLQLPT